MQALRKIIETPTFNTPVDVEEEDFFFLSSKENSRILMAVLCAQLFLGAFIYLTF